MGCWVSYNNWTNCSSKRIVEYCSSMLLAICWLPKAKTMNMVAHKIWGKPHHGNYQKSWPSLCHLQKLCGGGGLCCSFYDVDLVLTRWDCCAAVTNIVIAMRMDIFTLPTHVPPFLPPDGSWIIGLYYVLFAKSIQLCIIE